MTTTITATAKGLSPSIHWTDHVIQILAEILKWSFMAIRNKNEPNEWQKGGSRCDHWGKTKANYEHHIVSIKLLLFVMSAHSFKSVFYFLIIRSAFKNQSTEMWMNSQHADVLCISVAFAHHLLLPSNAFVVSQSYKIHWTTGVSMTHQATARLFR